MAPPMTSAMLRTRPPGITSARVRGLTLVTLDMGLSSRTVWAYRCGRAAASSPGCDNPSVRIALAANRLMR